MKCVSRWFSSPACRPKPKCEHALTSVSEWCWCYCWCEWFSNGTVCLKPHRSISTRTYATLTMRVNIRWKKEQNPLFLYWWYFIHANVSSLAELRLKTTCVCEIHFQHVSKFKRLYSNTHIGILTNVKLVFFCGNYIELNFFSVRFVKLSK